MAINYLNEDQELMIDALKDFLENELDPRIETDLEQHIFPLDLHARMKELGFTNTSLPEEYGGLGESMVLHIAIVEEVAKHNMTMAIAGTSNLVAPLIIQHGTPEQIEHFFPELAEQGAGFAFTEPGAGSDANGIVSTAVKDGDEWVINGQKTFISYMHATDWFLVSARTNETGDGGVSAFLVNKNTPGFTIGSAFHKLGMRGSDTGEMFLEDVRVPAINLIGKENKGLRTVLGVLDDARLGVAACGVGIAEAALAKAIEFTKERVQFGRPIASFQGIQWYAAECEAKIAAARALLYEVAREYDEGMHATVDTAKAKLFCTNMSIEVTNKCVQMCGGYGLTEDFGMERLYRDAKVSTITEGTDEILKLVIARALFA